ncbi:hypothetical protein [Catellatospora sichuanensis]|uniref:hypothetical protein n=1 Tax=Catellatospora sichuanensis TaxID=1969805 RepID=UPI001182B21C|nr:hypothetical protein [Catellatospora sichuanensis]
MAVPDLLRESWHDPVFWARYQFAHDDGPGSDRLGDLADLLAEQEAALDDEDDEDEPEMTAVFDVGGGHRLVLELSPVLGYHSLGIQGPGDAEDACLGWDDQAHWHPYALRWSELDLTCRALAARDPLLPHPGPALALLARFAAVFDDDAAQAEAMVDAAFDSLRPDGWHGYWPRAADWLARADFRGAGVVWQRDENGNQWAHQPGGGEPEFYSVRTTPPGSGDFPHDRLRALLAAAAATVAVAGKDPAGEDGDGHAR